MRKLPAVLLLCAFAALGSEGEISSDDIVRELKEGRRSYRPNTLIFNVKPISFVVGQNLGKGGPYPMKCLQLRSRLIGSLGIQAEPIFVLGGHGGIGFTVGPSYFPEHAWEDVHFTPKYEFEYINREGAFHGLLLEMSRHHLFGFLVLTYGGAVGFAMNGSTWSEDDEGNIRIIEIRQGLTYDVNLGIGFGL